jgi:hypothetical protein
MVSCPHHPPDDGAYTFRGAARMELRSPSAILARLGEFRLRSPFGRKKLPGASPRTSGSHPGE